MAASMTQAFQQYRAHLPTGIADAAGISFASAFGVSLLFGIALTPGSSLIISGAVAVGTFSMTASLIDSAIRPLLHLGNITRVNGNENISDRLVRGGLVTLITYGILSSVFPLMGIYLSTRMLAQFAVSSFLCNFLSSRSAQNPPNGARIYCSILILR